MSKSENDRVALLEKLGLEPNAEALGKPAKQVHAKPAETTSDIVLAPPGVDPHTQPVDEIVFDERLLDGFPSLTGSNLKAASDHVFAFYRAHGRNTERNGALHRKITSFITLTRRNRKTGGMVKEKVVATVEQRDLAALLASQGIDAAKLAEILKAIQ